MLWFKMILMILDPSSGLGAELHYIADEVHQPYNIVVEYYINSGYTDETYRHFIELYTGSETNE